MPNCPACDCPVNDKAAIRSLPQLRRYFKMIRVALENWPEQHDRQFSDETECRKFLQMAAGHRELAYNMPITGMRREQALMLAEAAIKAAGNFAVVNIHNGNLVIWKPKSIAFHKLTHQAACRLFEDVSIEIEKVIGVSGDELLEQSKEVA